MIDNNIIFSKEKILESLKTNGEYYFSNSKKKYLLYKWEQCDGCLLFLTEADNLNGETLWQSTYSTLKENILEFIEKFSA